MQLFENTTPQQRKVAGVRLPRKPEEWRPAILEDALTKYPFLHEFVTEVHLQQLDSDTGNGVGSIMVTNRPPNVREGTITPVSKAAYIPFVVSNCMLKRMEIFGPGDGEFQPITEGRVRTALTDPDAQFYPSDKKTDPAGGVLVPPPRTYDELISKVGGVSDDLLGRKKKELEGLPKVATEKLGGMEKSAAEGVSTPVAVQFRPGKRYVEMRILHSDLTEKLAWVSHPGAAHILGSPVTDPKTVSLGARAEQVKEAEGEETFITCDKPTWGAVYMSGFRKEGMLFPNTVKVAGEETGEHLFVAEDGNYATTRDPRLLKVASRPAEIQSHSLAGTGFFSYGERVTEPVYVSEFYGELGQEKIAVMAGLDEKIILTRGPVTEVTKTAEGRYLIPRSMRFIGLRERRSIDLEKEASKNGPSLEYRSGYHYFHDLPSEWEKAGQGMTSSEAALYLAGFGDHRADETVKEAEQRRRVPICIDMGITKTAEEEEGLPYADLYPDEVDSLLKAALDIDDITTVDRAMSLHFMTPQKIMALKGAVPYYEKALRHLANLLFSAQLGMVSREVREETVVTAIRALDAVISRLKVLGA